jgi:2,3-bisphosphoglycerate-independent phosphoglycerate mutase
MLKHGKGRCVTKYVIVLADGMADYPIKELNGLTPMEYAATPNLDLMAQKGVMGMVNTIPVGFPPGSDVANLSILGYDPRLFYTGRSPLEAVGMGVPLSESDLAIRCNLLTLSNEENYLQKRMVDYSADEISTEEAACLIGEVKRKFDSKTFNFFSGISYRHLLLWRHGPAELEMTPPHDIPGQAIAPYLPKGQRADRLLEFMLSANEWLEQHPINLSRIRRNLRPANSLWFWGHGRKPALDGFYDKYLLKGAVIAAVDLIRGLGICAGLKPVSIPVGTGNTHLNFSGKALAALQLLKEGMDLVYIHINTPDEAGHRGELTTKIKAIEAIDKTVMEVLLEGLKKEFAGFKIMVLPDHATPVCLRTHTADPVPFLVFSNNKQTFFSGSGGFSEKTAAATELRIEAGHCLMDYFIKDSYPC